MALQTKTFTNTCTGTGGSGYTLTMTVVENSINVSTNKSNVTITVTRTRKNSNYGNYGYSNPTTLKIDNSTVATATTTSAHNTTATQTLITYTDDIVHNSDGSKTINVNCTFTSSSSTLSGGTVSGKVVLTTIPRTTPKVDVSGIIEHSTSITISPYSDSFNHTLVLSLGSVTQTINFSVGQKTINYTIPTDFYTAVKTNYGGAGTGTTTLNTYYNGSLIGSSGGIFRISSDESLNLPTVNLSLEDTSSTTLALTGGNYFIAGYSTLKLSGTGSTVNGSPVRQIIAKLGSLNTITKYYNDNDTSVTINENIGTIQYSNNNNLILENTIIDARDFSSMSILTYSIKNYFDLVPNVSIYRDSPTGDKMYYKFTCDYWNDNFGATANVLQYCRYQVRGKHNGVWTNWSSWYNFQNHIVGNKIYSGTGSSSSATSVEITNPLDSSGKWNYKDIYQFRIYMVDKLSVKDYNIDVSKGEPVYNWYEKNDENYFNINGNLLINGASFSSFLNGENYTIKQWYGGGFITSNSTTILFTVPLPKNANGLNPTISSGTVSVYSVNGGELESSLSMTSSKVSIKYTGIDYYLTIQIYKSSGYNATDDTPVGIEMDNLVLHF